LIRLIYRKKWRHRF